MAVIDSPSAEGRLFRTMKELYLLSEAEVESYDIAELNLLMARDLPGAEDLDVSRYLSMLDLWVKRIQSQTNRHINVFQSSPEKFRNSEPYWRILALTTTLWSEYKIRYSMERINEEDWSESRDLFIHGLLGPTRTGTCATLPVLVVAIGRRLGYPLYLVRTIGHLFFRWDNPNMKVCSNFEFSGDGLECHTDQYYRNWPAKWSPELTAHEAKCGEKRVYLRNLTPTEEFSEALSLRAACLEAAGRWEEAMDAYDAAIRLNPNYQGYIMQQDELRKMLRAAEELMASVSTSTPDFNADLPALITAQIVDPKIPSFTISYKQLPHPILPTDPSFNPTFKPPAGMSPALFRIRRVVRDIHTQCHPMAGFKPTDPPKDIQ